MTDSNAIIEAYSNTVIEVEANTSDEEDINDMDDQLADSDAVIPGVATIHDEGGEIKVPSQ